MAQPEVEVTQKRPFFMNPLFIGIAAGVVALVLALSIVVVLANPSDKIANGIFIDGTSVSGMTQEEAEKLLLDSKKENQPSAMIHVKGESASCDISFQEIISGYDIKKAVKQAYAIGKEGDFFGRVGDVLLAPVRHADITLEVMLDETILGQKILEFSGQIDVPMEESTYEIEDDSIRLFNGKPGQAIDRDKVIEDIKNIINTQKDGYVTVTTIEAKPALLDAETIHKALAKEPEDAKYEISGEKGFLREAKPGVKFEASALKKVLAENEKNKDPYYFNVQRIDPANTQVDMSGLFLETLASYTSNLTDWSPNRLANVRLAASKINGSILNPGEEFSYVAAVSPFTTAAGYQTATVYVSGGLEQDIGGGVCQVSSCLYSAVLYADLNVTLRFPHSMTVGYVPYGQDATVANSSVDFRFVNSTNKPMKIQAYVSDSGVHVTLLGEKLNPGQTVEVENVHIETLSPGKVIEENPDLPRGSVSVKQYPMTGYVYDTYKHIYSGGALQRTEYVSRSVYKALDTIEIHGTGGAAETAKPAAEKTQTPAQTVQQTPIAEEPTPDEQSTPQIEEPDEPIQDPEE